MVIAVGLILVHLGALVSFRFIFKRQISQQEGFYSLFALGCFASGVLLLLAAAEPLTPANQVTSGTVEQFDYYDHARNHIPDKTNWGCFDLYPKELEAGR